MLADLTGKIYSSAVVTAKRRGRLGICPRTTIVTGGLGAADALAADRTGCGAPKPLLFRD